MFLTEVVTGFELVGSAELLLGMLLLKTVLDLIIILEILEEEGSLEVVEAILLEVIDSTLLEVVCASEVEDVVGSNDVLG